MLDFWNVNLGVYYKLEKKSISKQTRFFVEFELDFYCLCSLQKSISKSNWFFDFLNLIFRNWKKKIKWHSIFQKSSGDRQGVWFFWACYTFQYFRFLLLCPTFTIAPFITSLFQTLKGFSGGMRIFWKWKLEPSPFMKHPLPKKLFSWSAWCSTRGNLGNGCLASSGKFAIDTEMVLTKIR